MAIRKHSIAPVAGAVGLTIVALAAVGFVAFQRASAQLMQSAGERYVALMDLRRDALRLHVQRIADEARYFAGDRSIREAMDDFLTAWNHLGSQAGPRLRRAYVSENPNPVGERYRLESARDGSDYSTLHGAHHPWMRRFLDQHGYHDIFLVSPGGELVYSASKEDDFATSLVSGPYRESGLGQVFRAVRASPEPGTVMFSDFAPYAPSHGAPAAFVASPILAGDGHLLGVLAFQLDRGPIDEILRGEPGNAEAETYVVGTDFRLRNDVPGADPATLLRSRAETEAARLALTGQTGFALMEGRRGTPVLAAYGPLDALGHPWAVVTEVDQNRVLGPVRRLRNFLVVSIVVAIVVVSTIVGVALSWLLNRPAPTPHHATSIG